MVVIGFIMGHFLILLLTRTDMILNCAMKAIILNMIRAVDKHNIVIAVPVEENMSAEL